MTLKITIAQINTRTGDLENNTNKILRAIDKAVQDESDIVVFPETSITGYNCGDLFLHNGFISHQLEFLDKIIVPYTLGKSISVILGFVDRYGQEKDGFPHLYNSACHIHNGKLIESYNKILLARRGQHDDMRYFESGNYVKTFEIKKNEQKIKFSAIICQDMWNNEVMRDIVGECVMAGAQFITVLNQSYFYFKKQITRKKIVSDHCFKRKIPIVYVNAVGVGDITKNILLYDSGSFACNSNGDLIHQCQNFKEETTTINIELNSKNKNTIEAREQIINQTYTKQDKYNDIYNALKYCVREFFDSLNIKRPMVYLSGGIDSSVVASIVADAFDKENIVFVSSPTEDNKEESKNNAQVLADNLGIKLHWVSMQKAYEGFIDDYKDSFKEEPSLRSKSAYQAIGRTPQSIGIAHKFGSCANIGCSNQTENILGFSSLNDVANTCAIGLVNDLTKIEIFEMAEFINNKFNKEIIPSGLYNGTMKPSAELADNKEEDPYNYFLYAPICSVLIRYQMDILTIIEQFKNNTLNPDEFVIWPNGKTIYENVSLEEFIKTVYHVFELSKRSVFKSAQAGPTPIISQFSRGFSSRETIINHYKGHYEISQEPKIESEEFQTHFMAME